MTTMKDDTISRAAALDALDKVAEMFPYRIPGKAKTYRQYNEAWSDAIDAAENALEVLPSAQPGEDVRAMCGECDAWNKYKSYPQPEQFNPCTVCQEFDCTGCKFRRV